MSLTPEAGEGLANADAYASLVELAAYHTANARWTTDDDGNAVTDPQREAAARQAAFYMDGRYEDLLSGYRRVVGQSLAFPRGGAIYRDGLYVDPVSIPTEWKRAYCEACLRALQGTLVPDLERGGMVVSDVTGPLATTYAANAPGGTTFPILDLLLVRLVGPGNRTRRC